MKDFDTEAREVTSYMRERMSGDLPPNFVEDVMSDVHRTPQRRRSWLLSPLVAGVLTAATAVAVVGIGLSLIDRDGVGTGETPTPSASASPSATATPDATATPLPSVAPTWQMDPNEAFQPATTCENLTGLPTQEFGAGVAYRISMPGDWFHSPWVGDCMLFAPEPFEPTSPPAIPEAVAIWIRVESGGNYVPDGSVISILEYTVDGVPAIRYEIHTEDGGVVTQRSVVWIVGVASRLPSDAIDSPPYLAISTSSSDIAEFEAFVDVLDRMVATLVVLEPA